MTDQPLEQFEDDQQAANAGKAVSHWLDGSEQTDARPLDQSQRMEAADAQLIHALLVHEHDRDVLGRERRISAVMQALKRQDTAVAGSKPDRWKLKGRSPMLRLALAAMVAIVVGLGLYLTPSSSALATLDQVIAAAEHPVDRTYEITVQFADGQPFDPPPARHFEPRPGWMRPPFRDRPPNMSHDRPGRPPLPESTRRDPLQGPRPGFAPRPAEPEHLPHPPRPGDGPPPMRPGSALPLNGAILSVRGGNQFVLRRPLPDGRDLVIGSNGQQSWLVAPEGPVLISDNPDAFRGPLPQAETQIPFVNIRTGLELLRQQYDLKELNGETLDDDATGTRWRRLEGRIAPTRRSGPPAGSGPRLHHGFAPPKTISIWAHPETGVIRRIVFQDMPPPESQAANLFHKPIRLTIDLIDQIDLGDDYFDHAAHHEPERIVRRFDPPHPPPHD